MMLFFYETFTITSQEPPDVVAQRLAAKIDAPRTVRWPMERGHLPYMGSISTDSFQIRRLAHYRNSYVPVIRGRLEPLDPGTRVHITVSLHPAIAVFVGLWSCAFFGLALSSFLASRASGTPSETLILFLTVPILFLTIFFWAFWAEAKRSRADLTRLIRGE